MRTLRTLAASKFSAAFFNRSYARVHDVRIQWDTSSIADGHKGPGEEENKSMALNVFKQPLALHSTQPLTGFTRTGYCEVPASDAGNHAIAGIVTDAFLDFSAQRGNDLRRAGLVHGCKWCLCVGRWKEAFDARSGTHDDKVPRVVLEATNEKALKGVRLEELKMFAVERE